MYTVTDSVAVHPVAPVTVTAYVPALLTVIPVVVAFVDQRYCVNPASAVSIMLAPGQINAES